MPKKFDQNIIEVVWNDKYRYKLPDGTSDEATPSQSKIRMVKGVYEKDTNKTKKQEATDACVKDLLIPGGRIAAGAGTPKRVTWINCFVNQTLHDSMEGIMAGVTEAALTQQQGGGIGTDFSSLRPSGAIVKRTGSISTGTLPFMDMWHAMCQTIKSSGSRRGAMMGTISDWHPDLPNFIVAKQEKGRLTNFNISVLVSDSLMKAIEADALWDLGFYVPPADPTKLIDTQTRNDKPWYVYQRMKAAELWDMIIKNTYDWAEPGVIFIDRINKMNNLYYCEDIRCVNPCGEQPLPPRGDCDLIHSNLAKMVDQPFTEDSVFNYDLLQKTTRTAVRFADNVLDTSPFPLEEQHKEAQAKRRIGVGYSGLANAMQMLQIRYGHKNSVGMTESIGQVMRDAAYWESVELAKERGPFPAFDKDKYMKAEFIKTLPKDLQDAIAQNGIRNGVLLTLAPVGTGSLYHGNISSGLEPTIFWKASRKMLMPDNSYSEFDVVDYGYQEYCKHFGPTKIPDLPYYMVTANDLTVDEHLAIQAEAQKYIDASISKTLNCPEDMTYETFKQVYRTAYNLGCKGCTTYRPSGVRGAVITEKKTKIEIPTLKRPDVLPATVYKVKMPGVDQAFYLTISDFTDSEGVIRPFEIFINSKSVRHLEWTTALTRTISAIFRRGGDITFLIEELEQVYSIDGGGFKDGKFVPSLVALIGQTIKQHLQKIGLLPTEVEPKKVPIIEAEVCPICQQKAYYHTEGCNKCSNCGFSNCG
jgi:ribonucleoside-diphosphate reductase alpha chain